MKRLLTRQFYMQKQHMKHHALKIILINLALFLFGTWLIWQGILCAMLGCALIGISVVFIIDKSRLLYSEMNLNKEG